MMRAPGLVVVWRDKYEPFVEGFFESRIGEVVDLVLRANALTPEGSTLSYQLKKEHGLCHVIEVRMRKRHARWTGYYLSPRDTLFALAKLEAIAPVRTEWEQEAGRLRR